MLQAPSSSFGKTLSWILGILLLAAVYFGAARFGLSLGSAAEQVSAVWPATGIALAAVLLFGYRMWPGIALGALLANWMAHEPLAVACGIATGNTLEALAGAWLLQRAARFDNALERLRDVLALVVLAALLSTMISATIGVTSLCLGRVQPWPSFGRLWWEWWLGDAMGNLVVAPLLLTWATNPRRQLPGRAAEGILLFISVFAVAGFFFMGPWVSGHGAYSIFPFIVWAALRFEQRGATVVIILVSGLAIGGLLWGVGPFVRGDMGERLLRAQAFLGVVAITGLSLGAALAERRRAEASKRKAEDVTRALAEAKTRVEESLHAGAQRTQSILDAAYDAFIAMDDRGIIIDFNAQAGELLGWTAKEALGRSLAETIIPQRFREAHAAGLQRFLQTGESPVIGRRVELAALRKDGREIPVELMVSAIPSGAGYFFSAFLHDVSQRKKSEDTLRFLAEASATLATLVDYESTLQSVARLSVGFFADWCIVDTVQNDGTLHRVVVAHHDPEQVKAAEEILLRFPADRDRGHGPQHVLRTWKAELISDISDSVLREEAENDEHFQMLRALELKSMICVPLMVRGRPFGIITFATAESNRRYGPEDLKIAQDVVHRASVAIDNAKLYAELQQADRRKDEFLAMLAHELRNPLAPIRSGLDLLRIKGDDPATTHWVHETMSQQVTHMVRLVDDLMDVSRIMRGKVQLRPEPVEISTIVRRAVEVARPLIDSKQHELSVDLPPTPIKIQADPVRLTQVVANLLNNAAKYTDKGGRIRLSVAFANDQLILRVSDTGIGLTPDMQQHVFDLFAQADQSPERTQGGLGIGLTLVRSLVEMHGGRVEVSSEGPGRGSEFTVRLPAKLHRRDEASPPTTAEPSGPAALRVLVVDDNKAAATMVSRLLQAKGQTVEIAYDGPAALEVARQFHPDVVLLDIGLPGISGYEVARELRRQPNGNRLLLVAVTGYGQQEDRQRSQEAGFDVHLVKPLSLEELQRVIGSMNHHSPSAVGRFN